MTERVRSASAAGYHGPKMETDLSPRKTMLVLVIVVGCFAVLWPKVFYPMLVGSATQHIKPGPIDKAAGCCDVISETDVNTIKIMSELCGTIIKSPEEQPLTGKEVVRRCRQEVLETCGIDISVVLQEQVRLGQNVKQILDQVRSLNGSLCLKYNFGVAPWRLGVPHRITVKMASDAPNIRQERPLHLRSELIHPAFRERGRAIPQPPSAPPTRPPPRVVEGRPGPLPGMRPTLGGAGHVVPPSKQGTSSMSVIMPIYTIGIVIFFTYTLMRIIFKKQPEGVGGSLYPPVDPDPHFRKEVFESEASRLGPRLTRENISSKLVVNAMSALLDEVDQEIEARRKSSEVASQDLVNGTLSNGDVLKPQDTEEQPTVKVLGMEMTASCEGGKKWSRPDSPVLPTSPPPPPAEPVPPPQEIYLEGALPAQSHLLVADSATEPQPSTGEDPAVVLAGKMTLSVISLDSENGTVEIADKPEEISLEQDEPVPVIESETKLKKEIEEALQEPHVQPAKIEGILQEPVTEPKILEDAECEENIQEIEIAKDVEEVPIKTEEMIEEPEYEIEEYVLEPIIMKRFEAAPASKIEVEDLEKKLQENTQSAFVSEERIETIIQKPLIQLESEDVPHTVEVEGLEIEVNNLIQEAIENIEQREPIGIGIVQNLDLKTNELNETLHDLEKQTESEEIQIVDTLLSEGSQAKPTLQDVPDSFEKTKLIVEELTPQTDSSETEIVPIDKTKDTSITEQKHEDRKCDEDVSSKTIETKTESDNEEIKITQEIKEVPKASDVPENIEENKEILKTCSQNVEKPKDETDEKVFKLSGKPTEASQLTEDSKQFEEKSEQVPLKIKMPETDIVESVTPITVIEQTVKSDEISGLVEKTNDDFIEKLQMSTQIVEESVRTKADEEGSKFESKQVKTTDGSEDTTKFTGDSETIEKTKVEVTKLPKLSGSVVEKYEDKPTDKISEAMVKTKVDDVELEKTSTLSTEKNEEKSKVEISESETANVDVVEAPKPSSPLSSISKEKPKVEISETVGKSKIDIVEAAKPNCPALDNSEEKPQVEISEKIEKTEVDVIETPKPSSLVSSISEEKPKFEIAEIIGKSKMDIVEAAKPSSPALDKSEEKPQVEISEKNEKTKVDVVEASKPTGPASEKSEEKPKVDFSEKIEKSKIEIVEAAKPSSPALDKSEAKPQIKISEKIEKKVDVEAPKPYGLAPEKSEEKPKVDLSEKIEETQVEEPKLSSPALYKSEEEPEVTKTSPQVEEKSKPTELLEILTDDDELGSDEEIVEEIEEIVYESNEEESEEEEESEGEIERDINTTDSGAVQRVNGERSEDLVEESKYTTVSGATAAENDISDEELTDNEEVEDEEIIEVEEEIEDDDYVVEESKDVNHVSGESEPER